MRLRKKPVVKLSQATENEKLPEGKKIVPGQYWLYTDFAGSQVQTPFRIMTKEEEKYLRKNWKDLKKQHEAFLKQEAAKAKQ